MKSDTVRRLTSKVITWLCALAVILALLPLVLILFLVVTQGIFSLNFDFEETFKTGLDSFQQQGSYSFGVFGSLVTDPPGSEGDIFGPRAAATVAVTYFYIPEPPSAILLSLGLMPVLIIGAHKARSLRRTAVTTAC